MAKREIRKYVSVRYNGLLPEFNNIQGPILNPQWIPISTIKQLIYAGKPVYEHCITDPQKYLKLNKDNYDDFNMYPGNTEIEDPSVDPNTYLMILKDHPGSSVSESEMAPGYIYVEICE